MFELLPGTLQSEFKHVDITSTCLFGRITLSVMRTYSHDQVKSRTNSEVDTEGVKQGLFKHLEPAWVWQDQECDLFY